MSNALSWNFLTDVIEPDSLVLDCRSEEEFDKSTIKGAYGAGFVKKPYGSGPQSQKKLSDNIRAILKLAPKGKPVLCFDEGEGMYACRLAWLLHAAGLPHAKVFAQKFSEIDAKLLGKGNGQLPEEGGDNIKLSGIVLMSTLQENLTRVQLIDARTPEEYEGIIPRLTKPELGSICGRIPGSINWDWRMLYGSDGHIKGKMDVLNEIRKIGLIQERPTVIYDYNGARSCSTGLILSRCGYRQVSVYLGSWMEWRKTALPKQNVRTWKG